MVTPMLFILGPFPLRRCDGVSVLSSAQGHSAVPPHSKGASTQPLLEVPHLPSSRGEVTRAQGGHRAIAHGLGGLLEEGDPSMASSPAVADDQAGDVLRQWETNVTTAARANTEHRETDYQGRGEYIMLYREDKANNRI